jgi:hypothetical protein
MRVRKAISRTRAQRLPAIFSPIRTLLATGGLVDVFISRFVGDGKFAGLPALPVEFGTDRQRPGLQRQPSRIGEHNTEVLSEAGFTAAEIAGLAQAGVVAAQTG